MSRAIAALFRLSAPRLAFLSAPRMTFFISEGQGIGESPGEPKMDKNGVPEVLVQFGRGTQSIYFKSHPAVMMIARLLDSDFLQARAIFTQKNIDDIAKFDEHLAAKCQVAYNNNLPMNMIEIENLHNPAVLEMFQKEKEACDRAREEVMAAPKGKYDPPKALADYTRADPIPRVMRNRDQLKYPDNAMNPLGDPDLPERMQLEDEVKEFLQKRIAEKKAKGITWTSKLPPKPTLPYQDQLPWTYTGPMSPYAIDLISKIPVSSRPKVKERARPQRIDAA
eukprot:GHVN01079056.1.p1 GENE.GHVN01079056.1~~GHVN01079056.1.p1  ORF type:complete len:280 (+),score=25.64 GHVN01079056.1:518-1357(+)